MKEKLKSKDRMPDFPNFPFKVSKKVHFSIFEKPIFVLSIFDKIYDHAPISIDKRGD